MGPRRGHVTTALPRQLREELGLPDRYGERKLRRQQQTQSLSRKERRKAERDLKKKKQKQRQFQRHPSSEEEDISDDEVEGFEDDEEELPEDAESASSSEEPDEQDEPKKQQPRKIPKHVQEQLAQDDAEIAMLEKKLGIKGRKKLPKIFEEEGLAELLGDLGEDSEEDETRKRKRDDDEWLQRKRRKAQGVASEDDESEEDEMLGSEDELGDLDGIEEDEEDEDLEDDEIMEGDEDEEEVGEEDEDGEDGEEEEEEEEDGEFSGFDEDDEDDEEDEDSRKEQPKKKENPYVAPVSSSNRPKYVPPSLRAPDPDSEEQVRLRRQAQGALNKLSESNLISILGEVEKLYREYPRQSVTSTLATLLLNLVMDRVSLQDTFVILHAGFIAAIYKVIGMDFGAEIVQRLVENFDKIAADEQAKEGKQNLNLMSLLSQLYNFHVVGSNLVFDYIRLFLQEINETNTELLLKIIRNSGPQLRQDDASALKDIVLLIQPAVARVGDAALSVRTKFMIETITDLKNNRLKAGIAASGLAAEHIAKMRKILGSLSSRTTLRATEPLRVSREDIRNADKRGKWWLVGASWREDPLEAARQELANVQTEAPSKADDIAVPDAEDGGIDLRALARSHRMNTDVRRAIFIAIMSASDYRDAHVRLTKLRLRKAQEYEIPRVLIHCVMTENLSNPYYTLIARRLCAETGRRMKMAFQFTLWDVFKRMGETPLDAEEENPHPDYDGDEAESITNQAIINAAKFYGALVADHTLGLNILKILNFAYLQRKTSIFVEVLLITVFLEVDRLAKKRKDKKKKPPLPPPPSRPFPDDVIVSTKLDDFEEKTNRDAPASAEDGPEKIFVQLNSTAPQIVKGLVYFIRKVVAKTDLVSGKEKSIVKRGCAAAIEALGE